MDTTMQRVAQSVDTVCIMPLVTKTMDIVSKDVKTIICIHSVKVMYT